MTRFNVIKRLSLHTYILVIVSDCCIVKLNPRQLPFSSLDPKFTPYNLAAYTILSDYFFISATHPNASLTKITLIDYLKILHFISEY